jgi:hypothetical protein
MAKIIFLMVALSLSGIGRDLKIERPKIETVPYCELQPRKKMFLTPKAYIIMPEMYHFPTHKDTPSLLPWPEEIKEPYIKLPLPNRTGN